MDDTQTVLEHLEGEKKACLWTLVFRMWALYVNFLSFFTSLVFSMSVYGCTEMYPHNK